MIAARVGAFGAADSFNIVKKEARLRRPAAMGLAKLLTDKHAAIARVVLPTSVRSVDTLKRSKPHVL